MLRVWIFNWPITLFSFTMRKKHFQITYIDVHWINLWKLKQDIQLDVSVTMMTCSGPAPWTSFDNATFDKNLVFADTKWINGLIDLDWLPFYFHDSLGLVGLFFLSLSLSLSGPSQYSHTHKKIICWNSVVFFFFSFFLIHSSITHSFFI